MVGLAPAVWWPAVGACILLVPVCVVAEIAAMRAEIAKARSAEKSEAEVNNEQTHELRRSLTAQKRQAALRHAVDAIKLNHLAKLEEDRKMSRVRRSRIVRSRAVIDPDLIVR